MKTEQKKSRLVSAESRRIACVLCGGTEYMTDHIDEDEQRMHRERHLWGKYVLDIRRAVEVHMHQGGSMSLISVASVRRCEETR